MMVDSGGNGAAEHCDYCGWREPGQHLATCPNVSQDGLFHDQRNRAESETGQWIVQFDYRSDGGPTLVGPFATKERALLWLAAEEGYDFEANPAPMQHPGRVQPCYKLFDSREEPRPASVRRCQKPVGHIGACGYQSGRSTP